MNGVQIDIILVAIITACAAAIPGIFLVLQGAALMSDAISHAILPGIVIMFFIVKTLQSPWLIVGAGFSGVATVMCTQWIIQTRRLKKDAAIGLIFPLFFSIGVILISLYARDVHLDTDMVLLGELAFAPFNRMIVGLYDLGPYAAWQMGVIGIMNVLFVVLCYKELKVASFDKQYAAISGCAPTALYYALMMLTSITCVGAFDVMGTVVIVALMIVPAATAFLYARSLLEMIIGSLAVAVAASVSGYTLAFCADVSIAGAIATLCGVFFVCGLAGTIYTRRARTL